MLTPQADIDTGLFATVMGGRWDREYACNRADGRSLFVFRRVGGDRDLLVLRNDDICPGATHLNVPGIGPMYCHRFGNDPAFTGLQQVLDAYVSYDVLRYRPGKRITIAAIDPVQGAVIIKCIAAGIDEIYQAQSNLWESRNALGFCIGKPMHCLPDWNIFVQRRLPGTTLRLDELATDRSIAGHMAAAVCSLHRSDVCFDNCYGTDSQQSRSVRFGKSIRSRLPNLTTAVDSVMQELTHLERSLDNDRNRMVPIHGSLLSHQWLHHGEHLGLVDFSRAAMGHPELDIATFLAELDCSSQEYAAEIGQTFLGGFNDFDPSRLAYYRAHKHLARAFKASRANNPDVATLKTRRHLASAVWLLANIQERLQNDRVAEILDDR